ncbi:MAG: hypothetical protein WD512_16355, partial [Candidatus Paceibacterota bacterium]
VDLSLAVAPVYNPNPKGDVIIRDGALMSGEGKVWITESGKKVPIYSPEIFESLGLSWNSIKPATAFDMNNIPTNNSSNIGAAMRIPSDGTPVKADNSSQVYLFKAGVLRPLMPDNYYPWIMSTNQVITLPQRVIKQYPIGQNVPKSTSSQ